MLNERNYTIKDRFCLSVDQAMRAIFNNSKATGRNYPATGAKETQLSEAERQHSAALMRINHAGEVCAQALYHGQGLASRRLDIKEKMQTAALEEGDHLTWCHQRVDELNSHTSYLNPFWYAGAFAIGLSAGLIGDKWSLGFLAETEKQVVEHLQNHLQRISQNDIKSYNILLQMQTDEAEHRETATKAGAAELPAFVKKLMSLSSKIMVKISYWI